MMKLAIVALAAVAALSACKKDDDTTAGTDTTTVITGDTTGALPAPVAPPVNPTDTSLAPAAGTDSTGGMTDTTAVDTTKKM
jgi:hypothetical protein